MFGYRGMDMIARVVFLGALLSILAAASSKAESRSTLLLTFGVPHSGSSVVHSLISGHSDVSELWKNITLCGGNDEFQKASSCMTPERWTALADLFSCRPIEQDQQEWISSLFHEPLLKLFAAKVCNPRLPASPLVYSLHIVDLWGSMNELQKRMSDNSSLYVVQTTRDVQGVLNAYFRLHTHDKTTKKVLSCAHAGEKSCKASDPLLKQYCSAVNRDDVSLSTGTFPSVRIPFGDLVTDPTQSLYPLFGKLKLNMHDSRWHAHVARILAPCAGCNEELAGITNRTAHPHVLINSWKLSAFAPVLAAMQCST